VQFFSALRLETCSPPEPLGRWPKGEKQGAKGNLIFLTVCPVAQKYGKDEQEKTSNYQ
jgi:hypothetical protein